MNVLQTTKSLLKRTNFTCRRITTSSEGPVSALTVSMTEALNKLRIQNTFYAKVHVCDKAYIVTRGDMIHLPVRIKNVSVGDVLKLQNISSFGSREYTLSASIPTKGHGKEQLVGRVERTYLASEQVECFAAVVEHTKQPLFTTIKKKRRNRHAKAVTSKQPYTVLRIRDLRLL